MDTGRFPLIIITAYNRRKLTMQTLAALERTTAAGVASLVVINDASTDDTHEHLAQWVEQGALSPADVYHVPENMGCPRALNYVMARHRSIGQSVVKIDNDVEMLTEGWVPLLSEFLDRARDIFGAVGMVMANYPGCTGGRLAQDTPTEIMGHRAWIMEHTIGHAVWHTGALLDEVGFFDVLDEGHRYGFEDLLMSVKSRLRGMAMLVWEGWQIDNIQRSTSLGAAGRDTHVKAMRPLYEARRADLLAGGVVWTNALGQPAPRHLSDDWPDRYDLRHIPGQVDEEHETDERDD